jgi:hypothetical protein
MAAGQVASADVTVVGQVALNELRMDGALVPTGTTVLSPSLLETGAFSSTIHLATGQSLKLAPNSSAYLEASSRGEVAVATRSGVVEVGRPFGEPIRLASNTVALLAPQEPATGAAVEKIKMCRADRDPVWVELSETAVQNGIDQGWGVAGVDPYDQDCRKKKVAGIVWTPAKVTGLIAGTLVAGYVIGDQLADDDAREVRCQSPDASPIVPGVPICTTG